MASTHISNPKSLDIGIYTQQELFSMEINYVVPDLYPINLYQHLNLNNNSMKKKKSKIKLFKLVKKNKKKTLAPTKIIFVYPGLYQSNFPSYEERKRKPMSIFLKY